MKYNFYGDFLLENKSVKLEPMASKHFDELLPIALKYPDLLKFSPSRLGTTEFLEEYFQNALGQKLAGQRYPFVIFDKTKRMYVGSTSFGYLTPKNYQIEIGWTWIGKEFQRTGINRHCKYLLLKYAFETLKCKKVVFRTDSRNIQSQNAIRSIGGKYEGELKKTVTLPDGHIRTSSHFSILENEWPFLKSGIFLEQQHQEKEV